MIKLYDNENGKFLGTLNDQQLQFLIDHLEEETPDDTDYYINKPMVETLAQEGADPALLTLLRQGLGEREEMEVRWEEEG